MKYYSYYKSFLSLEEAISEISELHGEFNGLRDVRNLEDLASSKLVFSFRSYEGGEWSAAGYSRSGDVYFSLSSGENRKEVFSQFAYYAPLAWQMPEMWERFPDPLECIDLNEVAIMRDLELLSLSLKWTYTAQGCTEFYSFLNPIKAIFSIMRWHNEIAIGTILSMTVAELRHRTFDYCGVPLAEKARLRAYEGAYRHALQAVVTACCEALDLGCIALGTGDDRDIIVFRDYENIAEE